MRRTAVLLALATLAGCVAGAGAGVEVVPFLDLHAVEPGSTTEFAFALHARRAVDVPLQVVVTPRGWDARLERAEAPASPEGSTVLLTVTVPPEAPYQLGFVWIRAGPEEVGVVVDVKDHGDTPLRPGLGALVRTVGFWDNGTVFYTNMKEVRDNPGLRFDDLGGEPPTEADFEPLKVYVGGERGVAPPEPYNTSGYRPVIEGFDARLRGMREGETRAVRIPPEQAYTRPGNEDHPLYGDALNFVVQVARVDDLGPAPDCGLPICPPGAAAVSSSPRLFPPSPS